MRLQKCDIAKFMRKKPDYECEFEVNTL